MANRYKLLIAVLVLLFTHQITYAQTLKCPPNIDFELGTFSSWQTFIGTCCPINAPSVTAPLATRHEITSGTSADPYGGFPVVAPGGGLHSLKLGNDQVGSQSERARYYIRLPAAGGSANYYVTFKYAVVLQDPQHAPADQPRFEVNAYDSATNTPIPCAQLSFVASSNLPGFTQASTGNNVYYKPWSQASLNLSGSAGKTIALDFSTGDCALGAHFGYGYFDVNCGVYEVTALLCSSSSNTIKLMAPPGFQTYKWMDSALTTLYGYGQNLIITKPSSNVSFAVIITPYPGFGCTDTLYTHTTVTDLSINVTNDTSLCTKTGSYTLQLDAGAVGNAQPLNYSWVPATGLSCSNCAKPTATFSSTMNYMITVTDTNGCTKNDFVKLEVIPSINTSISTPKDTVCQYDIVQIDNNATNDPATFYGWSLDTGNLVSGGNSPHIKASWGTPGLKQVKLHASIAQCDNSDSLYLYVKPGVLASFDIAHDICLNQSVTLTPKQQDAYYHWTLDGPVVNETSYTGPFKVSWNTIGVKNLSLLLDGKNGCTSKFDYNIVIHEFPDSKILDVNKAQCVGDTIRLTATENKDYFYEWSPSGYFIENNYHDVPMRVERATAVYLRTFNKWGCSVYDTTYINTTHCCDVFMPDAFTPNGDGKNDIYHVVTDGKQEVLTFIIKDRWGKTLYSTTSQYLGWDGTYKGVKQDYGVYFYYVKYKCTDGTDFEKKGNFILIR